MKGEGYKGVGDMFEKVSSRAKGVTFKDGLEEEGKKSDPKKDD